MNTHGKIPCTKKKRELRLSVDVERTVYIIMKTKKLHDTLRLTTLLLIIF